MKTTFVFMGERNIKKILEGFENKIILPTSEYNIYFLTNKEIKQNIENDNVSFKIFTFDGYSTDNEMLEYLFQNEALSDVIIAKSTYENINFEDFNRILRDNLSTKQIIISKQNKQVNFLGKIWGNIKKFFVKILFGFRKYSGEADLMYLNPLATSIVKNSPKRSPMFIHMNSWAGLSVHEMSITTQPKKRNKTKLSKSNLLTLSLTISSLLGLIVGNILFALLDLNLPFLALLSYILVEVAMFGYIAFYCIKIAFISKYGKLNFINEAVLTQTIDKVK